MEEGYVYKWMWCARERVEKWDAGDDGGTREELSGAERRGMRRGVVRSGGGGGRI